MLATRKRVLVYPCGTEIALEIYRSVSKSTYFELIGGSSDYDHGRFVYKNHIDNLPFITDNSPIDDIKEFNNILKDYNIDYIYPAMDGVLYKFAQYKEIFDSVVIAPDLETATITRSKTKTYELFKGLLNTPRLFSPVEKDLPYPLFIKPASSQGSQGAVLLQNDNDLRCSLEQANGKEMVLMEYLPGEEYTIDCFTNTDGKLIYVGGRGRKRIKNGISVNAVAENDPVFIELAGIINSHLNQIGGWFFQVKKNIDGKYSLLEVASRIAGASAFARAHSVNLPLMTLYLYSGQIIDSIIYNEYGVELDRALYNCYKLDIDYTYVYVDYDDTLVINNIINTELIMFLFQCINKGKILLLITKYAGDIHADLKKRRLDGIFDEIISLNSQDNKVCNIKHKDAIFIDDSYGERANVKNNTGIYVFDTHMIECLLQN